MDWKNMTGQEITEYNRLALPIYKEACRILTLPVDQRRAEIEKHEHADRLAKEVKRIWEYRKNGVRN